MMATASTLDDLQLDETTISGENGDVNLFQWLRRLENALKTLQADVLQNQCKLLEDKFVKVATGLQPYPLPNRPIRRVLSRCLVTLYSRIESRSLYDTLQALVRASNEFKSHDRDYRSCTLYCAGELMSVFGAQVMSLTVDLVTVALRICKITSNPPALRYQALMALQKTITGSGKAVPESLAKDLLKAFRAGLGDKIPAMQRGFVDTIAVFHTHLGSRTLPEIEGTVALCVRHMDNADVSTRNALADAVGLLLSFTQRDVSETSDTAPRSKASSDDDPDRSAVLTTASEQRGTLLSPRAMLQQLSSAFNKQASSHRTRLGIMRGYVALLNELGPAYVEANYRLIAQHLLVDLIAHPTNRNSRYEVLVTRNIVGIILRDQIGIRMLSEQGQIGAIQDLVSDYLHKWPALLPGQTSPDPLSLIAAMKELSGLLHQLGSAPPFVQAEISASLVQLLAHPQYSVRIAAAWGLQQFCLVVPGRLSQISRELHKLLEKDLESLTLPARSHDLSVRTLGHSYGLAALFAVFPRRPLYVSYDLCAQVLETAIHLLNGAGEHELEPARVEVEVSWTLIASLMGLGPYFVQPHLSQLLVLWRNAFPRLSAKDLDTITLRSQSELVFLFHIRQSALGAVLQFLQHNSGPLVTLDVSRRLTVCLNNALLFSSTLSSHVLEQDPEANTSFPHMALTIRDLDTALRREAYRCFALIGVSNLSDAIQANLLDSVVQVISAAEGYGGSPVQASIAASAGAFASIWQATDGFAYGISTTAWRVLQSSNNNRDIRIKALGHLHDDPIERDITNLLEQPVVGSCEYDLLALFTVPMQDVNCAWPQPPPAATGVVDAAIDLFANLVSRHSADTWTRIMRNLRSPRLDKDPGRKVAVHINVVVALLLVLPRSDRESRAALTNPGVSSTIIEFLKATIVDVDPMLRAASSEAFGLLAALLDTSFLAGQVKYIVDQVLSNRDPYSRTGCAMTLGSLYSCVGGLAAGPLLKTIVNILMSLSGDPHPLVHYWALNSLSSVIDAAGLSYSPHIPSTLGMLTRLYMSEAHEPESRRYIAQPGADDLPAYAVMSRIVDSIVAVLGPEVNDSARIRTLVLDLVQEFSLEAEEEVVVEALQCLQNCLMFARDHLDVPDIVLRLRRCLSSSRTPLKCAAINALYLLVQKDVLLVSRSGGDQLAEALFGMLDTDPGVDGVREIITSWLSQTVSSNPSAWVALCQKIMSQVNPSQQLMKLDAAVGLQDDESQSLNDAGRADSKAGTVQSMSRWRTQLFALQCLHSVCATVATVGPKEQLDLAYAKSKRIETTTLLVSKVPDLIRMAFTASTAYVPEIRLAGLAVLRDVIEVFSKFSDPDVPGVSLLEQYQAPIAAALTPAFSADSTPELLASGIELCAIFVGSGIVEDATKMGRVLKLLVNALSECAGSNSKVGVISPGDVTSLSPNAIVMLKVSTLSAWAKLEARRDHPYLRSIVLPHRAVLCHLWVECLVEYARLKAHSEVITTTSDILSSPTSRTSSILERDVIIPYYDGNWLNILAAVTFLMKADDHLIFAALNGTAMPRDDQTHIQINGGDSSSVRSEPCLLHPVLLGLLYEVLVDESTDASASSDDSAATLCLRALECLVQLRYTGKRHLDRGSVQEILIVLHRIALAGSSMEQSEVLYVVRALATARTSQHAINARGFFLQSDVDDDILLHCVRICISVLQGLVSAKQTYSGRLKQELPSRIQDAFDNLMIVACLFPADRYEDIRATAVHLLTDLLQDESDTNDIAGVAVLSSIPCLLASQVESSTTESVSRFCRTLDGFLAICIREVEQLGGREGQEVTTKIQNNLLAGALIITSAPHVAKLSLPTIDRYCRLVSDKLLHSQEGTSLSAVHCMRMLMTGANIGNSVAQSCIEVLLPSLVAYVHAYTQLQDSDSTQGLDESLKVLKASLLFAQESEVTRLLCILVPLFLLFLNSGSLLHRLGVSQLLHCASTWPLAFRDVSSMLPSIAHSTLETAVREALTPVVTSAVAPKTLARTKQISLKQF